MPESNYHIEIESDPNNLITVEEFVNYFAKDLGLNEEQLATLLLAVTEATTNAIIHANKCDKSKLVTVDVNVQSSKLVIKVYLNFLIKPVSLAIFRISLVIIERCTVMFF